MDLYPNASIETARVECTRLRKRYESEIYDHVQNQIKYGAGLALDTIVKILKDKKVPKAVQLKAAKTLLDYAGHKAVEKKEISILDRTDEEIDTRLMQLLKDEAIDVEVL